MTPRKPPKAEHARELILTTALHLFVAHGYFATSVHDIRRAADLSIGSIYHHFSSKEAIARALYDELMARMTELVASASSEHKSSRLRGWSVAEQLCQAAQQEPEKVKFILHARHHEFLPEAPPICSSRPFELMQEIVRDGIASGEIRPMDPIAASLALFGGVIRLIQMCLDDVLQQPATSYLEEVWEASWRGISS
ncbi:TetR/AcrR family transcriptional regulator [Trichlorobacter lovleyi]|uniref:TetR/AcrR family transcriptional regulator n=1 Tax=Trichlorobacter lovleyi TaxID=313985 RepID=UPI0022404595|nr:TetR/AcrR family transcriptional regulator [Trichlorobacter lovleyi]QOX77752.1 TetR/AcrR family transcriptional regulator [Trichlorobacter lovleyi]